MAHREPQGKVKTFLQNSIFLPYKDFGAGIERLAYFLQLGKNIENYFKIMRLKNKD